MRLLQLIFTGFANLDLGSREYCLKACITLLSVVWFRIDLSMMMMMAMMIAKKDDVDKDNDVDNVDNVDDDDDKDNGNLVSSRSTSIFIGFFLPSIQSRI